MKIEKIKEELKKNNIKLFWNDFFRISFTNDGEVTINGFVDRTNCGIDETWDRWKASDGKKVYQKKIDNITIVLFSR